MSSIELRYLASREWMESEILAGRPVENRRQTLSVDLEEVDAALAKRVERIADGILFVKVNRRDRICVLDSGIDPELSFGPSQDELRQLDAPIVEVIGDLPELPAPCNEAEAVVGAWEQWMRAYREEGLRLIGELNANPPTAMDMAANFLEEAVAWEPVEIEFGDGLVGMVSPTDGAGAIRDARAGVLWEWAASKRFSSESVAAAYEATAVKPLDGRRLLAEMPPADMAELFLERTKKLFQAAKAHHRARRAKVPDFEVEMRRWAQERGSKRLRLGLEDGYRMNSRYLTERIAAEAPGMYAMPASAASNGWAVKASSPTEQALRLRRRVAAAIACNAPPNLDSRPEAEICIVKKPPHPMFEPDRGVDVEGALIGTGLPSRKGWPWSVDYDGQIVGADPNPFEAVVVRHWLGRFHLIGAVADATGAGPPGIWAVPELEQYNEDGTVVGRDPDERPPAAARRKPPDPPGSDDDIPF